MEPQAQLSRQHPPRQNVAPRRQAFKLISKRWSLGTSL